MLRSVASTTRRFSTAVPPNVEEVLVNAVKNAKIQPVLPPKRVVILPPTDDIARKYKEDIASGRSHALKYKEIHVTDPARTQPVYTADHSYRHRFVITELTHNDFLKKMAYIERQMNKKFGSTYNLRVRMALPKFHKRFTVLKSAFVHKKAQQHFKYLSNTYELSVTYAFEITDAVINDYIYETLKKIILSTGGVKKFGYSIKNQPRKQVDVQFMVPATDIQ